MFPTLALALVCHFAPDLVAQQSATLPQRVPTPGIENCFQLSPRLFSGGQPDGDEAFAGLKRLGIRTIISVDGMKPDVKAAHRHGLRYVHLPHGYDGIPANTAARLVQAAQTLPGPIFVHCHHGNHRGPAAAAIMCLGTEPWDTQAAIDWMKLAGTSTQYAGLYDSVRSFRPPTVTELKKLPAEFPEIAPVSDLITSMTVIDRHWDKLKASRKGGFAVITSDPDLRPVNEAVIIMEQFRELRRTDACKALGTNFQSKLGEAESQAAKLRQQLEKLPEGFPPGIGAAVDESFEAVSQSCAACHSIHRNKKRPDTR